MPLSSEQAILFTEAATFPSKCSPPSGPLFAHFSAAWKKTSVQSDSVNGCLTVMRASSPPRSKEEAHIDALKEGHRLPGNPDYLDWVVEHPSALDSFEEIVDALKGRQLALFLDYDGTLSPIVEDPARAFMSTEMRSAVKSVAKLYPTSIITGRSREKVYEFVQLPELYYAGSHGMDIMGPAKGSHGVTVSGTLTKNQEGEDVVFFQPASRFLTTMREVFDILERQMSFIEGARVEDNKFCLSVHFRQVREQDWQFLAQEVQSVLKRYPELSITHGRKVLEIRPSIKWDKGKAVEYLLEALGLGDSRDVLPVYIGDDRTDEDAFEILNNKFNGYGILVSNVPKTTGATYSLRDTSEVQQFLKRLVQIEKIEKNYHKL
ncbi:probable trehalose-phosphate phosphatase D [Selaginella moellendorffii]|uniref:probable trehalose-phosphate phosphatase D n=1 Tax=Selaginella moellendorffii TaxID=88036 RepID=UPI000D1C7B0A|nr:probable trehalose-phosphate phosphatase D [Selaginella moellendorffii]XP_024516723.1 probable trehalose-phosphate phosphatase D [Selaginella moellendorffii]XP_024516725.1 probable trehalose-phosphate phosphatase D [Selaginella moellendorffii]XP_024516726.1 probable trehalose-phosphate phosphatase D [Selaginella moellendorffii]XP_024516727.1 probable trehalose-phosphate phosphatase D [Selaginella moellendorffii]XP_024516728.1 probable trehalose-phosphate phosphatase D [Selaginella moellendo|eukprot:XP_024516722.1 probable trehalose-phosphate phosphatase D [Selaginella moellendorffii]